MVSLISNTIAQFGKKCSFCGCIQMRLLESRWQWHPLSPPQPNDTPDQKWFSASWVLKIRAEVNLNAHSNIFLRFSCQHVSKYFVIQYRKLCFLCRWSILGRLDTFPFQIAVLCFLPSRNDVPRRANQSSRRAQTTKAKDTGSAGMGARTRACASVTPTPLHAASCRYCRPRVSLAIVSGV